MDFAFNAEQEELRDTVRRFLARKSPETEVRRLMATDDGYDRDIWKQLAGLGLQSIAIPEDYGGAGFGYLELSVILEEMGRALLCAPYFSTVVLAVNALLESADEEACATHLPQIASGDLIATFALPAGISEDALAVTATADGDGYVLNGFADYVMDGHVADFILVPALAERDIRPSLFAVSPASTLSEGVMQRRLLPTMDETRKLANLSFRRAPARLIGSQGTAQQVIERVRVQAAVALASEQVGLCQWGLAASVGYGRTRFQFARPIGSFQAVKHKIVDMLVHLESAKAVAYYAAWAAEANAPDLGVVSSLAKSECSEAALEVTAETIQVHGGIGTTWEHPAHLYFKRAESDSLFLGDPAYHRELMCQQLGI